MSEQENKVNQTEQINKDVKKVKTVNRVLATVVAVLLVLVSFIGGYFANFLSKSQSEKTIEELISIIVQKAYPNEDGKEFDEEALFEFFKTYYDDKYAAYYTKEEYEKLKRENSGNYQGIGVSFYTNKEDTVAKVLKNSPAEIAGFKKGDRFLSATDQSGEKQVFDESNKVLNYLSNVTNGQTVTFEVNREGETLELTVTKAQYIVSYVEYFDSETKMFFRENPLGNLEPKTDDQQKMSNLDRDTAYISLDQFEGGAGEQFGQAIQFMKERGRTKLILDLRDNGGGSMNVLIQVASYLVYNKGERESIIAFASEKDRKTFFSTSSNNYNVEIEKTVVLANQNTASASECLIGAMLHYGKSEKDDNFGYDQLVITKNAYGEAKTYGKGIMQTTYELKSGGAFKLTTAKILWPDNATCIHGVGIVQNKNELNAVTEQGAIPRAIEIMAEE